MYHSDAREDTGCDSVSGCTVDSGPVCSCNGCSSSRPASAPSILAAVRIDLLELVAALTARRYRVVPLGVVYERQTWERPGLDQEATAGNL